MKHVTYMPRVHGQAIAGQADPCGMVPLAAQFAAAWMEIINGKARGITCHPLCTAAAQTQADFLAVNDFVKGDPHIGANGSTANERLVATGYRLPDWMMQVDNVVESAIRTWGDPAQAAHDLAWHDEKDNSHVDHMQFRGSFWGAFSRYGVGCAQAQFDERSSWFFVCVTAPEEA